MAARPAVPAAVGVLEVRTVAPAAEERAAISPARLGGHGTPDPSADLRRAEAERVAQGVAPAALGSGQTGGATLGASLAKRPTPCRPVQTLLHTATRTSLAAFRSLSVSPLPAPVGVRVVGVVVPAPALALLGTSEAARAARARPHPWIIRRAANWVGYRLIHCPSSCWSYSQKVCFGCRCINCLRGGLSYGYWPRRYHVFYSHSGLSGC